MPRCVTLSLVMEDCPGPHWRCPGAHYFARDEGQSMMRRMMRRRIQITMALCLAMTSVASAITLPGGIAQAGLPLGPLSTVDVPEPANLADFVQDKGAAIALGKALFWDTQVGSDGIQ